MKKRSFSRIISLALTLSMLLTALPANILQAHATDPAQILIDFSQTTIKYSSASTPKWQIDTSPGYTVDKTQSKSADQRIFSLTTGNMEKFLKIDCYKTINAPWPIDTSNYSRFTIKITVPVGAAASYAMSLQGITHYKGAISSIYVDDTYMGDYSFYNYDTTKTLPESLGEVRRLNSVYLTEGEHSISFRARYYSIAVGYFYLYKLYLDPIAEAPSLNSVSAETPDTLMLGKTNSFSAQAMMSDAVPYHFGLTGAGAADTANTITVTSSDTNVATVNGLTSVNPGGGDTTTATITPLAPGTTTITTTATVGGVTKSSSKTVTVKRESQNAPATGGLTVTGKGVSNSTITSEKYTAGGSLQNFNVGDEVTLTAPTESGGKSFRYWKNATSGRIVTTNNVCNIKIGSNTYLTAVYSKAEDGILVEFKDRNGKILQSGYLNATNTTITPPADPYSVGYSFLNWSPTPPATIDATTVTSDTVFDAIYEKAANTYNVEVTGSTNDGIKSCSYNDLVTVTANVPEGKSFARWERNGTAISFNETYSFYVWDGATVNAVYVTGNVPAAYPEIMMDTVKKGTNRLIFSSERTLPDNYQLVETGILISTSVAEPTLSSYEYKAISQSTDNKGQFTARKDSLTTGTTGYARAYMIYKTTEDTYVLIYSNTVSGTV